MNQRKPLNHHHARLLTAALTILLLFVTLAAVAPARAAGMVVTSAADTVAEDGFCTLREAIIATNTDTASGAASGECAAGSGADTISFDAGLFAPNLTITLDGSQLPAVTTAMTITGNGVAATIIEASTCDPVRRPLGCTPATYRVFEVAGGGNLTLDGMTVRHGRCAGACSAIGISGGGILNSGILTVTNSSLSDNLSTSDGGGVYNLGTLTVINSTLSHNWTGNFTTGGDGGGISNAGGTLNVTNSTLSSNGAYGGASSFGGGISNAGGALNVTNSTLA